jgi:hypothetical protein
MLEPVHPGPLPHPVQYEDSLMTQHLLEAAMPEASSEAEVVALESAIERPFTAPIDARDNDAPASQTSPEPATEMVDDPWQASPEMTQGVFEQAMAEATGMDPADPFESMHAAYEQQLEQCLEGIVQDAMPEEDPFETQRRMYDQQMQLMDPFAAFAPGQIGPGFGPMGPMPGP